MTSIAEQIGQGDLPLNRRLTELWETPHDWFGWISTVDHKRLGKRYIYAAFAFFFLGGVEAVIMRTQLARADSHLLSPDAYNQLMTMHGVTMMFLFAQPVLSGFSFYLTPLMIGARELAFPRLNAFSYYVFVLAGLFMYASFAGGQAPNSGWFNYTPLASAEYNPRLNIDFYCLGLIFLGIATTVGAANSIVTIFKLRAPGMSIDRMPLFMWSSLTISVAVVFSMPPLTTALGFLELERRWHFVFFDPSRGGSALLWQHLFWVFGHPWVYIVFLPATGMLSMIIPTFCRRPMVGHTYVALATVATGLVGFGVWVHHMFATGLPQLSLSFFSAGSMTVSLPSAVTIFAWLATMWYGRVVVSTPMLFALGFIVQFVIGGISGVMTAAIPFDWQVTDTYFVVAHLHYVLAGGTLFGVMAGLYYWVPKMYGFLMSERLGKVSFWLMFIGFNVAFFPMHIAGLMGMPRRIYTYSAVTGLGTANLVETIGVYVFAVGLLVTLYNFFWSKAAGAAAGANPWGAASLEWVAASPPQHFNFAHVPVVRSREPLWNGGYTPGPSYAEARLTPSTSSLDAAFEETIEMPRENAWSVIMPLTLLLAFSALLLHSYVWAAIGLAATLLCLARWMWPSTSDTQVGWWGMVIFLLNEAALFASLLSSYFYLGVENRFWPPAGTPKPRLGLPLVMTVVLLSSSGMCLAAEKAYNRGKRVAYRAGTLGTMLLGIVFLLIQAIEYRDKLEHAGPSHHAYESVFFTITGLHGAHVAFGVLFLAWALLRDWRGTTPANASSNARREPLAIRNASVYWHFVDGVWLVILASLYLSPRWY